MQNNLSEIIDILYSFSTGNTTIQDFALGNLSEITTSKSQKYPLMYVEVDKAVAKEQTMTIHFNVLMGDQENHSKTNRKNIYSDILLLQNDLISYLQRDDVTNTYTVGDNITLTPFSVRFNNQITGWFMNISITTSRFNTNC